MSRRVWTPEEMSGQKQRDQGFGSAVQSPRDVMITQKRSKVRVFRRNTQMWTQVLDERGSSIMLI